MVNESLNINGIVSHMFRAVISFGLVI